MSTQIPIIDFELLSIPERQRYDSTSPTVIWLDATMLMALHMIFPAVASWAQLSRMQGFCFRMAVHGILYVFATTPLEEMIVDDRKNKGFSTDWGPWDRAGSGVGIVSEFENMRVAEYLIVRFGIKKSHIPAFAIEYTDRDFHFEPRPRKGQLYPPCPLPDQPRNECRLRAFRECARLLTAGYPVPILANRYYFRGSRLGGYVDGLRGAHGLNGRLFIGAGTGTLGADLKAAFSSAPIQPMEPTPHPYSPPDSFSFPPLGLPTLAPSHTWTVELPRSSIPKRLSPPSYRLLPAHTLRVPLDTNTTKRRWKQTVAFLRRLVSHNGMVASLPRVRHELGQGSDPLGVQHRLQELAQFLAQAPSEVYGTNDMPAGTATMIAANGPPHPTNLWGDLRIRVELSMLCDLLAVALPNDTILLPFLTHDGGARRLMLAIPSVHRVRLLITRLIDDPAGPLVSDVLFGLLDSWLV